MRGSCFIFLLSSKLPMRARSRHPPLDTDASARHLRNFLVWRGRVHSVTNDQREIQRMLRFLAQVGPSGNVSGTCRYFDVGRASFCRWRDACQRGGDAGLTGKRSVRHGFLEQDTCGRYRLAMASEAQVPPRPNARCSGYGAQSRGPTFLNQAKLVTAERIGRAAAPIRKARVPSARELGGVTSISK